MKLTHMILAEYCKQFGIPAPEPEFRFFPERRWRADYGWPAPYMILLEIEGGAWNRGRHNRPKGFIADMEKYNTAAKLGYRIIRCTPQQFESGEAIEWVAECVIRTPK